MRGPFQKSQVSIKYYEPITFHPMSEIDQDDAMAVLAEGVKILEALGYPPVIASGTLLGFVRDKGFIPHDTDLDLNILVDINSKVLTKEGATDYLKVFFLKEFRLVRAMFWKGTLMQTVFVKNGHILDIEFIHKDIWFDKYVTVHEHGFYLYEPKFFKKFENLVIKGRRFKVPSPVEKYLEHRYGKNWKIPTKEKGDWEKDASNLILWTS